MRAAAAATAIAAAELTRARDVYCLVRTGAIHCCGVAPDGPGVPQGAAAGAGQPPKLDRCHRITAAAGEQREGGDAARLPLLPPAGVAARAGAAGRRRGARPALECEHRRVVRVGVIQRPRRAAGDRAEAPVPPDPGGRAVRGLRQLLGAAADSDDGSVAEEDHQAAVRRVRGRA